MHDILAASPQLHACTNTVFAETGRKALKILGIEETEGLNKQELVIFLYAVGLVSCAGDNASMHPCEPASLRPCTEQAMQHPRCLMHMQHTQQLG